MGKPKGKAEFKVVDEILPTILDPKTPVKIRLSIERSRVRLFVGARDWEWDRRTRQLVGSGTCISDMRKGEK